MSSKGARTGKHPRRSRLVDAPPRGFRYEPEFLTGKEEERLVPEIEQLPFETVRMHGVEARRQVAHFGVRYAYDGGELVAAPALPLFLASVRARVAAGARFPTDAAIEALVTRYPAGAGIGWHRDAPAFGPVVVGISLLNACELRLRLATEDGYELHKMELAPRSLYVLAGTARFRWQHAIPPVPCLRYSITFRTVKSNPPIPRH